MKKKFKKFFPHIIGFIIGAIGGVLLVFILPPIEHGGIFLLQFFAAAVLLVLGFVLHIFAHELGHLVAGKMSGYGFVSIRFFNVIFIKKEDKITRKKFNMVGAPGQCLMSPPETVNGKYPFVLYNLGGGLMNIIVSLLLLALYLFFSSATYSWMFLLFIITGFVLGITNLVPLKQGGLPNDGHNILTLGKNDVARRIFWNMMNINALIAKGFRYRDIPVEQFELPENANQNNIFVASAELMRFNWLMDRHDFMEAKALAELLLNTVTKMPDIYKNELHCELLFFELIGDCRKEEIDRLYSSDLKKYIKATSSYMSRQRLMYAYTILFLRDEAEAAKTLERFNKNCSSTPFLGEIACEREMIEFIDGLAVKSNELLVT